MIYESLLDAVLMDWSYFSKDPVSSVERGVIGKLRPPEPDIVTAVQGVRRCGKSTLLSQIMTKFNLPRERCFFINFEDPRLSDALDINLLSALIKFADSRVDNQSPRYFFLDEIQNVKEWEKWLRLKVDRPTKDCFIITGSNSTLLSGELATVLTGRHLSIELFPFSLREYLTLRPESSLLEYLKYGGFPRPLQSDEPFQLLRQYFSDIVERDVRRNVSGKSLIQVAKAVFESTGSELSARSLSRRIEVSTDTMINYLNALTQAYLILPCPYFTFSERKRLVRNNKWYPIDCGMMHSISVSESSNIGKSFETIVFHALKAKYKDVYYWRDQGEVDFVVIEGTSPRPIQVSWDGIKDRHKSALLEFASRHPSSLEPIVIDQDNFLNAF